ncbi:glycosyltransferase [Plantactinospora sp. BB1]|uniref:glycosyltransferase n=1 Tax=Plantactinospora sp. BB1 TaxID=2071627 RepID=UPI000D17931C|nr:glycosyltransferase [Plantactinospora sp. BB1]AVT35324.1 UDP-glucose--sterol glucosyltransferase [Plantactinospora sp. BB1]
MRVLIVTAGSLGDVAPYTGLGARLRAAGHRVALAAPEPYADLVTGAGLDFRPIAGDLSALRAAHAGGHRSRSLPVAPELVEFVRLGGRFVAEVGTGIAAAAGADTEVLLLSSTTAPLGYSVAQYHNIPCLGVFLQPTAPTRAFPPVVLGVRSLGGWGNRLAGRLGRLLVDRVYADASRRLRAELSLPPVGLGALARLADGDGWAVLHGYSPAVLPRPPDWPAGLDVVGYWWPAARPGWQPPTELVDFLAAGPPPVYVGFGSLADTGNGLHALVAGALRRAGVRGVLQGMRDAGTARVEDRDGDLITVGDVPHDWLFPQMAALVHHAGCGTTGAGLRAGVPAVPVPVFADQPFWAARLTALGVGPTVLPFRRLDEAGLATAIRAAVAEPGLRRRAEALADLMAAEDGAGAVVAVVDRLAR